MYTVRIRFFADDFQKYCINPKNSRFQIKVNTFGTYISMLAKL